MRTRYGLVATLFLAVLVPLVVAPEPARAVEGGMRLSAHSTYRVDPPAGVVHVVVDVTVTNEAPDRYSGGVVRQTYFAELFLPVLAGATNAQASTGQGRTLAVSIGPPAQQLAEATIDLAPDLFYRQTQAVRLSYDVPNPPPRTDGLARVSRAHVSLFAISLGDPGLASVEVVVPAGYDEVEAGGASMSRTESEAGEVVYTATAIEEPDSWSATVIARTDGELTSRRLSVAGHDVTVRAWPEDPEWADFVSRYAEDGLPVLERLTGRPWPTASDLDLTESVSPYLYGFGGWYLPGNAIEIGNTLEADLVLHELSHIWFNDRLFGDRWILEGLADEFAACSLEELGEPLDQPLPVDRADPGALRLNQWADPALQDDRSPDRERFGYNTSWSVLREVSDEIGMEALGKVVSAALDDTIAYGGAVPVRGAGRPGWRQFLDLLERVGGSQRAQAVFEARALGGDEPAELVDRARAQKSYGELVSTGAGWSAPVAVRKAMASWDFDRARRLIATARDVLGTRDQIDAIAERGDLSVPTSMERTYERASGRLDDAAAATGRVLRAAEDIAAAAALVQRDDGMLASIGLWGAATEKALDDAGAAFAAGDTDRARRRAADAGRLVAGADDAGQARVAAGAVAMAVLAASVWGARRWRVRS